MPSMSLVLGYLTQWYSQNPSISKQNHKTEKETMRRHSVHQDPPVALNAEWVGCVGTWQ